MPLKNEPESTESEVDLDVTDPGRGYFMPVAVMGVVFCLSLFIWLSAGFGEQEIPLKKLINKYGAIIILVETALLAGTCVVAMYLDRQATLTAIRQRQEQRRHDAPGERSDR